MLISGVLKFDPQGRVILSAAPVVNFNGGTPITADGGLAGAPGAVPDLHLAGLGYLDGGRLTDSNSPLVGPVQGVLGNDLGQVRISFGLPFMYYAGLPLTEDGHLAVSPGEPPPDLGAFDHGFDSSFDIGD